MTNPQICSTNICVVIGVDSFPNVTIELLTEATKTNIKQGFSQFPNIGYHFQLTKAANRPILNKNNCSHFAMAVTPCEANHSAY